MPVLTDSRRLHGPSAWLDAPGVILEAGLHPHHADTELEAWRAHLEAMCPAIGWPAAGVVQRHGVTAMLAVPAPVDALMTAILINEWAWIAAATDGARRADAELDPEDERLPTELAAAVERVRVLLAEEANPPLMALEARARAEQVPILLDDDRVSCGYGVHSVTWPRRELPPPDDVDWEMLRSVPVALVTGSNGKTTTVRMVAAMLAQAGHTVGFCCSDGVYIDGEEVERGDWSGPSGARLVLRDQRVTAAVLETARGGLLRRGLVVPHATAAIVTNVAVDHFGEYGIHSLDDLARTKLLVARALGPAGTLVLNADDPTLNQVAHRHPGPVAWFSASATPATLPPLDEMPSVHGGAAAYNLLNAAGAALVAGALGVADMHIHETLTRFGERNADNPGRLERFSVGGVRVWIDYAHNPHGLSALLDVAQAARGDGRMGLLLGQAGDRDDESLRALARAAWAAAPEVVVVKEMDEHLRGRQSGEVPTLLCEELRAAGATDAQLREAADELAGVRLLLEWCRQGDLLVLPVHALSARTAAIALLTELEQCGWSAGEALPESP